jgi:DNA-damage-inducible protein D
MSELNAKEYKRFEDIKHIRDDGGEYWLARELSSELDYTEWRNFSKVLDKAKLVCKNSGFDIDDHFVEVNKTIQMPKTASKRRPAQRSYSSRADIFCHTDAPPRSRGLFQST